MLRRTGKKILVILRKIQKFQNTRSSQTWNVVMASLIDHTSLRNITLITRRASEWKERRTSKMCSVQRKTSCVPQWVWERLKARDTTPVTLARTFSLVVEGKSKLGQRRPLIEACTSPVLRSKEATQLKKPRTESFIPYSPIPPSFNGYFRLCYYSE